MIDPGRVALTAENVPLGRFHHVTGRINDLAAAYRSIQQKIAEQPIFGQMTERPCQPNGLNNPLNEYDLGGMIWGGSRFTVVRGNLFFNGRPCVPLRPVGY